MIFNYETGCACLAHADKKRSNESRGLSPWAFQHLENEESEKKPEKEQPANSSKPMNKQTTKMKQNRKCALSDDRRDKYFKREKKINSAKCY